MTRGFYDELAPYYHLIFEDWSASIERQGLQLDAIIRAEWGPRVRRVLDAAAGIGTQTLGLLARDYGVTASDLSKTALARARQEALARGFRIPTAVADLRSLSQVHGTFDLVVACDNAVPHLLSDAEILQAFRECLSCTERGGGLLISVRDYGAPPAQQEEIRLYYAVPVARLVELAGEAGFVRVRRIDEGYYQPIIVATRPTGSPA